MVGHMLQRKKQLTGTMYNNNNKKTFQPLYIVNSNKNKTKSLLKVYKKQKKKNKILYT